MHKPGTLLRFKREALVDKSPEFVEKFQGLLGEVLSCYEAFLKNGDHNRLCVFYVHFPETGKHLSLSAGRFKIIYEP